MIKTDLTNKEAAMLELLKEFLDLFGLTDEFVNNVIASRDHRNLTPEDVLKGHYNPDIKEYILSAFDWVESYRGYQFWGNISKAWVALCNTLGENYGECEI